MLSHITLTVPSELLSEVLEDLLSHKNFEKMMKKQQLMLDVSHSVNTKNGELVRRSSEFHHIHSGGNMKNSHLFDRQLNGQKHQEAPNSLQADY